MGLLAPYTQAALRTQAALPIHSSRLPHTPAFPIHSRYSYRPRTRRDRRGVCGRPTPAPSARRPVCGFSCVCPCSWATSLRDQCGFAVGCTGRSGSRHITARQVPGQGRHGAATHCTCSHITSRHCVCDGPPAVAGNLRRTGRRGKFAQAGALVSPVRGRMRGDGSAGLGGFGVGFLEPGGCMGEPRKRMGERRQHMGKVARMCGDCRHGGLRLCMGAARSYGEQKPHEKPEYGNGRRPADFACFWQYLGAASGHGGWLRPQRPRRRAPRQAVGTHGVPAVALPDRSRPAGACRRTPP